MKILFIWNNIFVVPRDGSGARSHNQFLVDAFKKLGHEVFCLEPIGQNNHHAEALMKKQSLYRSIKKKIPGIVTEWLRDYYSIIHDAKFGRVIEEHIQQVQPDVIYERFTDYHTSGIRAAKKTNLPYLAEVHAPLDSKKNYQRLHFKRTNQRALEEVSENADGIIVVSSTMKTFLIHRGIPETKIRILPNAVDPELFARNGHRDSVRQRLGISDRTVIGFVGTMKLYHGLDLLPDVCEIVRKKIPNICFLLVGRFKTADQQYAYEDILIRRELKSNFILAGGLPVEEIPAHIEAMDICIMPDSNSFGSPIKLFEYGALAKPVVMPRYQPIEDVLVDGKNGLLFEPGSVADLADKILRLLQDEQLRSVIGENLYQDIVSKHTWTHNAAATVRYISELQADRFNLSVR